MIRVTYCCTRCCAGWWVDEERLSPGVPPCFRCGGRLYVEARGQTVVVDILNGSRRDAVTERTV